MSVKEEVEVLLPYAWPEARSDVPADYDPADAADLHSYLADSASSS